MRRLRALYPHQQEALDWSMGRDNIALFMEMRLGKSAVAIRWARTKGERVLIVAPLSTLDGWETELELEHIRPVTVIRPGVETWHLHTEIRNWAVTNYEQVRTRQEEILSAPWDVIILDESTRIRNPTTQTTKLFVKDVRWLVPHRAILSGLPAPESPLDYFEQFHFTHGEMLRSRNYWDFRSRNFKMAGFDWVPNPGTIDRIKKMVRRNAFVLTRRQAKMGPKKVYEQRHVNMSAEQQRLYTQVSELFAAELKDGSAIETKYIVTQLTWLARLAGGWHPDGRLVSQSKVQLLLEVVMGELRHEQVVIWFRFNRELSEVVKRLRDQCNVPTASITGKTEPEKRKLLMRRFNKGWFRVICMQMKIGQFGIDLSGADTAIYFSNGFSMLDRYQSEDRIIKVSKRRPMLYLDLVTRDSIDEDVVSSLLDKRAMAGRLAAPVWRREMVQRALRRVRGWEKD